MNLIRVFLWSLASVMILQGFLSADEYGTATSMIGGISLTMSVWKENLAEGARSWFRAAPKFIPLPRVIVQSALRETALHPGIQVVPKLQATLKSYQRTWSLFREEEIRWMLTHSALIGGVVSDPAARALWEELPMELALMEADVVAARKKECHVRMLNTMLCDAVIAERRRLEALAEQQRRRIRHWQQIIDMDRRLSAHEWWDSTSTSFKAIADAIARLHDIECTIDPRLDQVFELVATTVDELTYQSNIWLHRLLLSLLQGEVWAGCLEHVRQREGRVRDLMMVAGIQDMVNAHDRVLNASLRVVSAGDEKGLVLDWFGEMSGYAWFLPDDLPSLVRRCVGQVGGDCVRIGPTEIVDLMAKAAEGSKILADWTRRLFIGLWNALPIVGMLFVMELIVLCVQMRPGRRLKPVEWKRLEDHSRGHCRGYRQDHCKDHRKDHCKDHRKDHCKDHPQLTNIPPETIERYNEQRITSV